MFYKKISYCASYVSPNGTVSYNITIENDHDWQIYNRFIQIGWSDESKVGNFRLDNAVLVKPGARLIKYARQPGWHIKIEGSGIYVMNTIAEVCEIISEYSGYL